ncbi:MAG: protein-tyrosine-phosphatase [Methylobacteriaceae bacterium]|nr:protein-tyrosine-phosphatase [Methylobacteriaceae bacterium]
MTPAAFSLLTVCGLEELETHRERRVTDVLSLLDPGAPEPSAFDAYNQHHRVTLRFHDIIEPQLGLIPPEPKDVEAILKFGKELEEQETYGGERHLLIHCHMGISRSTAAMAMLLAQAHPEQDEEAIAERLTTIRPKAWPNTRMTAFADEILSRDGRLTHAAHKMHGRLLALQPHLADVMRRIGRGREVEMAIAP